MRIKQQTWKATRCGWFNRSLHYTALFSGSSDHGIWALAGLLRRHGARTTLERSNTASSSKKDLDLTVIFYMPTKWKSHFFIFLQAVKLKHKNIRQLGNMLWHPASPRSRLHSWVTWSWHDVPWYVSDIVTIYIYISMKCSKHTYILRYRYTRFYAYHPPHIFKYNEIKYTHDMYIQ